MKPMIAYGDLVQDGFITPSGGVTYFAGAPVTNMATMQLSKRGIVSSGTTIGAVVDWGGESVTVRCIALLGHNFEITGETYTLNLQGRDSEGETVFNVEQDMRELPTAFPPAGSPFARNYVHVFDEPQTIASLTVQHFSTPIGIHPWIGRLWASPVWEPPEGIEQDWTTVAVDPGTMGESSGGQGYPREKQVRREAQADLSQLPYEWAYGRPDGSVVDLQQLSYLVGKTKPVIALPRTVDIHGQPDFHAIHRLGVYGRFTQDIAITGQGGDLYRAALHVRELF